MRALIFLLVLDCGGAPSPPPSAPSSLASGGPSSASASSPPPVATVALAASSGPAGGPAPSVGARPITNVVVRIGEIAATPHFDPHATLEDLRPNLLACYRKALETNPEIRGKVTLRIHVGESGVVVRVEAEAGGAANDPQLVSCIDEDFKANARFPKPGGSAIVVAPLVFHSEAQ
ncbi:MAG TPA: AgmX/PglI C-terminal domain-containing protein [Polyangiaceae bacterium]|nr:AgmX/PglI C-terminal domain-containing protein [Polyangiaceae bacterium]